MLPHFIKEHLIHSSDLYISRKHRTTLALLRNFQFYEVCNKQVLNFIDLQCTILKKVKNKLELNVTELNGTHNQSDIFGTSIACPEYCAGGIIFGKYIHQSRGDKKVYILIKCWEQMVVIRKGKEGFALQAEYEEVQSFKMCKGKDYQARLAISFLHNKEDVVTYFPDEDLSKSDVPKSDVYKKMLDTIKIKQSELLVHKAITKKEFAKLKSTELFGSNYLRTPELEEMQILSKCGNAWYKHTAADDIVIGVPLVNNSSSRLTVLRNMRAVVQGCGDLNYKFTFYQLSMRLEDIESIQGFFQSQDNDDKNSYTWSQCTDFSLRPEAFCVLVLRIKINEYLQFDSTQLPLFAFYDIVLPRKTFSQKCFLTTLSFREIFTNDSCRLNFHENHLHRDMLTVISTSYQTDFRLVYSTNGAAFEDYICTKMGFFRVSRPQTSCEIMQIDGQDESNNFPPEKVLFYNKNPDYQFHGTLLVVLHTSESCCDISLYTKTAEKSKVFLRLLNEELNMTCGIKETRLDAQDLSAKLVRFEAALRDELHSSLKMCSNSGVSKGTFDITKKECSRKELNLNELKTDTMFKDLLS